MLESGQSAPPFTLPDADMEQVDLSALLGRKHVVLYFYPKDDTPGCTTEALEFSDLEQDFADHDCMVLGVSPDDCISHAEFRDRHGITVKLLSDGDAEVAQQYDCWKTKSGNGIVRQAVLRSTFVIDRTGVVRHALYGVSARGHAEEVLELVKVLDKTTAAALG